MTATATATIPGIKALTHPPSKGEHYLSINLAKVDPVEVWDIARELGFKPELVQVSTRFGIEIHALLFHETTDGNPLSTINLDAQIDKLADKIDPSAIRHTYGGRLVA
jgi:hypothetical protein